MASIVMLAYFDGKDCGEFWCNGLYQDSYIFAVCLKNNIINS
jgi:hypothetical protein